MAQIPSRVPLELLSGLPLPSRGKVRDAYVLPDAHYLLMMATNRISIFDFVLPAEIPLKGEVLTALNIWWTIQMAGKFPRDVVAYGKGIDDHLPERLRNNSDIQKRGTVIKRLTMIPVEAIVRDYLTGSALSEYTKTAPHHTLWGHRLEAGFPDGSQFAKPIFTPTTKESEGHDQPLNVSEAKKRYGADLERRALEIFRFGSEIACGHGIIIADTKFEFGQDVDGNILFADECLTPDSSRLWLHTDWVLAQQIKMSPPPYDKQLVRDWGKTIGINLLDPLQRADIETVDKLTVPPEIIEKTSARYLEIFRILTGMSLETFQSNCMGVAMAT